MGEPDEDVLAWAFQSLAVILDETEEALYVGVFLKVNRQYVPHIVWSTATFPLLAGIPNALGRIKRIETLDDPPQYYRVVRPFCDVVRTVISESSSISYA